MKVKTVIVLSIIAVSCVAGYCSVQSEGGFMRRSWRDMELGELCKLTAAIEKAPADVALRRERSRYCIVELEKNVWSGINGSGAEPIDRLVIQPRDLAFLVSAISKSKNPGASLGDIASWENNGAMFARSLLWQAAVDDLEFLLSKEPADASVWMALLKLQQDSERYVQTASRAIKSVADPCEFLQLRAEHLKKTDWPSALRDFNALVERAPLSAAPYVLRGEAFQARKDYKNAFADYDQALKLSPNADEVLLRRAVCREAMGLHKLAAADCSRIIQTCRQNGEVLFFAHCVHKIACQKAGLSKNTDEDRAFCKRYLDENPLAFEMREITYLPLDWWQEQESAETEAKAPPAIVEFRHSD